ncbi:amidophosphoribosyltransferase [Candidatus Thorarchaeota archaeon]|nr:MAG: amidophosphoribosyltransferase [Candidatus Thorarchaeota archaeon]
MCGVLGILGDVSLANARQMLLLLTHRGQDASGLLWVDDDKYSVAKAMGSPDQIELPHVKTSTVLGSTRYPTTGRPVVSKDYLRTFVGPFSAENLAMTHNGNITNLHSLSEGEYDCDSEFMCERLNHYLKIHDNDLVKAIRCLDKDLDGAYSIAGVHDGNLFAFRDPKGFKPLAFGRGNGRVIVASESTVLEMGGVSLERDIYPGELMIFSSDTKMESYAICQNKAHSHCFFEYVYFAHPAAILEGNLVYDTRFRLGRALARKFKQMQLEQPDYVVPVPDTSRPAAQALAEELDVPMREIILKNRYLGRTFILRSQKERDNTAKGKYIYLREKVRGKNILVIDDSIVRGTTAKMIISDLHQMGASKVYFAVTCPPQSHPCYYGIDIATDKELIASELDIDAIARHIGADALIYQDATALENAIGLTDMCTACLDGEYPTEHARLIRRSLAEKGGSDTGRDYERAFQ